MLWTPDNTVNVGRPVADIIDANGLHHDPRWTREVNDVTGRVMSFRTVDSSTGPIIQRDDAMNALFDTVYLAAPLVLKFGKGLNWETGEEP
jgi:hypothetical protein